MKAYSQRYVRTDLALELKDDVMEQELSDGVEVYTDTYEGNIKETIIRVTSRKGERILGKPIGTYITLENDLLRGSDEGIHEPFVAALNRHLSRLMGKAERILVIGLGNRAVTPDALGPYVVDNLYITRHLIAEGLINNVRELSAISPGVMAQTGIETRLILKAICRDIRPDIIIAVDALAARDPSRLNSTIQICDTGISPGAGVGNNRGRLDEKTLGVKVIAIGVPTVISVPAIVNQSIERMVDVLVNQNSERNFRLSLTDEEKYEMAYELVEPSLADMFVTPKNIDEAVRRVSFTISEAINRFFEL